MSTFVLERERCNHDGRCVAVCPGSVLELDAQQYPREIAGVPCIRCGQCVAVCPTEALTHTTLSAGPMPPVARDLPAPHQLDGLLFSRRSVRVFRPDPVDHATLAALLEAGRYAPTAKNNQFLHWIVADTPTKVKALADEVAGFVSRANTPYSGAISQAQQTHDRVMHGATAAIFVTSPASYRWNREDGAIALTFVELAAEARGLGVCWAGYLTSNALVNPTLHKMLHVPENQIVVGGLMLGHPAFGYRRIPTRNPLSAEWI